MSKKMAKQVIDVDYCDPETYEFKPHVIYMFEAAEFSKVGENAYVIATMMGTIALMLRKGLADKQFEDYEFTEKFVFEGIGIDYDKANAQRVKMLRLVERLSEFVEANEDAAGNTYEVLAEHIKDMSSKLGNMGVMWEAGNDRRN